MKNKPFWESLGGNLSNVIWADFHTVLIDEKTNSSDKLNLFKAIKESSRKKIYVANGNMGRAKDLFNIDTHVIINPSNWFDTEYDRIYETALSSIETDSNHI